MLDPDLTQAMRQLGAPGALAASDLPRCSLAAETAAVPPLSVSRAVSCSPRVGLGVLFERPDAAANVLGVIAPFSRTSATFPVLLAGAASSKRSRDVCSLKMLQAA